MRRVQLSSLILTNQISRNEALSILDKPSFSDDMISQETKYVASKLDISVSQLQYYHAQPLKFYYDYPNMHSFMAFGEKIYSTILKGRRGGCF